MSIILEAAQFAANAHAEQFRKHFRNRPYFYHVAAVAGRVAEWGSETEVAAAYLHDTLEDTNTTQAILEAEFGPEVANLVVVGFPHRAIQKSTTFDPKTHDFSVAHTLAPPSRFPAGPLTIEPTKALRDRVTASSANDPYAKWTAYG